jgi:hypothetical protein
LLGAVRRKGRGSGRERVDLSDDDEKNNGGDKRERAAQEGNVIRRRGEAFPGQAHRLFCVFLRFL